MLAYDIVSDQLACGRRIHILNIVDDYYCREYVTQLVDVSISGLRVEGCLDGFAVTHGAAGDRH